MIVTTCLKERYQIRSSSLPHSRRNPTPGAKEGEEGTEPRDGSIPPTLPDRPHET